MAGLPKRALLLALVPLLLTMVSWLAVGQGIQTPPTIIDVQTDSTTLDQITDIVGANPAATDEQKALLIDLFAAAVDAGTLEVSLVGQMLDEVGWQTLDEGVGEMISLIDETLAAYLSGGIDDPVAALLDAHNASLTPDGIANAVTKAGASPETLDQVQNLVASGIPPGIVLRVTRAGLRDEGLDVDQLLADLAAVYAENPDTAAGQAANEATNNGSFKHQEQEENENGTENEPGVGSNEHREKETNENGSSSGKGSGKAKGNDKKE